MIVSALAASASDIIALIDGTTIEGRVEEVTATIIKYRKASNPTGPLYSVEIAVVRNVLYENGSVDSFNNQAPVRYKTHRRKTRRPYPLSSKPYSLKLRLNRISFPTTISPALWEPSRTETF